MALTKIPGFIIDSTSSFTFADATVTANVIAGNIKTNNILYSNGSPWTFSTNPGGSNTQIQYNNNGSFDGSANFTFTSTTNTLTVTNIVANGSGLTNLTGSNVIGQVSNSLVSGTVYINDQPNITSLGTLTSLTVTNKVTAGQLQGDGGNISNIQGSNVSGTVSSAITAGTVTTNAQPNITSVGTLSSLTVSGNFTTSNATVTGTLSVPTVTTTGTSGSITGANNVSSNYFTGNGYYLSSLVGSNVTGQVGNALIAGTVYTNAQPNITSVGTLTSLTVTGNVTASYFIGNGSQLTGLPASYSNTNVAAYLPTYTGNFSAGNVTVSGTLSVPTVTTTGGTGSITGANNISSNYFTGSGQYLSSLVGANVTGQVGNSLVSGTVYTAAQPNITSVGTLTGLTVSGDATVSGNFTVGGTTSYINVTTLNVKDPIIEMGGGTNGAPLSTNDGKDRGSLLHYYTSTTVDAFMGWDNSNAEFGFGSNVSVSSEVVTFNSYGNIRAGYFIGNGSQLTGLPASYSNSNVAAYLLTNTGNISAGNVTVTGNITTGNATVTGTLSVPSVTTTGTSGSITGANNVTSNYFTGSGQYLSSLVGANVTGQVSNALIAGTVYTNSQPNITSVGTLTSLTVTGNVSASYFIGDGSTLSSINGSNVTGQVSNALISGTVYTNSQPNITSVGTLTSLSVTGNVSAAYFIGNGSTLTNITGSNVTGTVSSATSATTAGTVTTNAQPNITSLGTLSGLTSTGTINLTGTSNVTLGDISNLHISGGNANYVLQTDGTGNLSWAAQTGSASALQVTIDTFTANGVGNTYTLSATPTSEDFITVNIDGVTQLHSSFSLSGNVVTIAGTPVNGAILEISTFGGSAGGGGTINIAGSNTQVQYNDSGNLGASSNFTFDSATNTLNATNITQNTKPVSTISKSIALSMIFSGF